MKHPLKEKIPHGHYYAHPMPPQKVPCTYPKMPCLCRTSFRHKSIPPEKSNCACDVNDCDNGNFPVGLVRDGALEYEDITWGGCPKCVKDGKHLCDTPTNPEGWRERFDRETFAMGEFDGVAREFVKSFMTEELSHLNESWRERMRGLKSNEDCSAHKGNSQIFCPLCVRGKAKRSLNFRIEAILKENQGD